MTDLAASPLVRFFKVTEEGRPPQRADRAAGGTLPTRAFRYCEAVTTAAALGWYIFPPIDFQLYWDGDEILWTYENAGGWFPLGASQFPNFRTQFDDAAPEEIKGYSPTFLGALPEPGVVQVWSGLFARSRPGWSLLVRPPVNLPRSRGYDLFEGMVEADRWFGPLFINVRLTRTHAPVEFAANMPLFQVQPVHRASYTDENLNSFAVEPGLSSLGPGEWSAYHETVVWPSQNKCPHGRDATAVRKRRRLEMADSQN
ncbi:DUF6065 family protein [Roseomonas elaeocarpi]|uniref:DUF6065 family protein n=1 Tax=Roseomonas elaeocarpi TaxID=907779 RepID=A0ABV6JW04_9PROT